MKRSFTLTAIFLFSLSACQKDAPSELSNEKVYPVSFTVTNFKQTVVDYPPNTKASPTDRDEFINHLWFFIYGNDDVLDWYMYQDQWRVVENDHFGDIHLTLPNGDFKLIVVGAKNHLSFPDSMSYSTAHFRQSTWWEPGDIFYKEVPFLVTGGEIKDTVKIDRISSMLEFDMTETATDILFGYDLNCWTVNDFPFDANGEYGFEWLRIPLIEGQFEEFTQKKLLFRAIILPRRGERFDPEVELVIHGPRMNGDVLNLNGIYVYPNKKTIVTGSLLNSKVYQNFYIDVDSTYADTTYIHTDDVTKDY